LTMTYRQLIEPGASKGPQAPWAIQLHLNVRVASVKLRVATAARW